MPFPLAKMWYIVSFPNEGTQFEVPFGVMRAVRGLSLNVGRLRVGIAETTSDPMRSSDAKMAGPSIVVESRKEGSERRKDVVTRTLFLSRGFKG